MTGFFKKETSLERQVDWDSIYKEYLPRVYNFFRYRVGDDTVAEELTSHTFEKAWSARQTFRQEIGSMAAWLFAIARNVANDHFRTIRLEVQLDAIAEAGDSFSVEDQFLGRDEVRKLGILLNGLSPRERELLACKYGGELTNREIARLTGLSESNVGTILNRAITKLRAEWESDYE